MTTLYYTPIPGAIDTNALIHCLPHARKTQQASKHPPGRLLAYALLSYALDGIADPTCALQYTATGKPYLPGGLVHVSLSHCRTHVLVARSDQPIGCDIERNRPVSDRLVARVLADGECPADFFAHWTLKESFVKLHDAPRVRFAEIPFICVNDMAQGPGVVGWVYRIAGQCVASVVGQGICERPGVVEISADMLVEYARKKRG